MLQEVHHYIEIDKSSYVINGLVIDTDKFILCVLIKGVYWTSLTKLFQRKIGCMVIQHRKDWMNKILWVLCYIQSKSTHLKFLWFYSITNAEKIMEILKKSWCEQAVYASNSICVDLMVMIEKYFLICAIKSCFYF